VSDASMQEIDYLGEKVIKWQRGASTFLAWPQGGARLMNWHLHYGDGSIRDIIHWPDSLEDLKNVAAVRGGNPILFPFCGRSFDQGEMGFWRTPEGERLPMPIHGFAKSGKFELLNLNQNGFSARLLPIAEDQKGYPYRYEFTVSYRFEELALYVELRLHNLDTVPIPWSAGHHFYFTLPSRDGASRADYGVFIPAKEAYRHANDGSLVPVADFPQEDRFDSAGLRDRIHTRLKSNRITFGPTDGEEQIEIRVGTDEKPDPGTTVVTWTETDTSPFYCVEPWMGPPNSPAHKSGLHFVPPGRSQSFLTEVHLRQ
jgi:galactose mutarotase-like enzyme